MTGSWLKKSNLPNVSPRMFSYKHHMLICIDRFLTFVLARIYINISLPLLTNRTNVVLSNTIRCYNFARFLSFSHSVFSSLSFSSSDIELLPYGIDSTIDQPSFSRKESISVFICFNNTFLMSMFRCCWVIHRSHRIGLPR